MIPDLTELQNHPFNLIGLADREKFHTGMLAFALRSLLKCDSDHFFCLVSDLWQCGFDSSPAGEIIVDVEQGGIDLVVARSGAVTHWAEVKLKTGLGKEQIRRYEEKHPSGESVLLGLFPEETGSTKTRFRSFPKVILNFFQVMPVNSLAAAGLDKDRIALIKLWAEYLSRLRKISVTFEALGLGKIPDAKNTAMLLRNIKLLGIFERYRYGLVGEAFSRETRRLKPALFNTNGNAGLEMRIEASLPYGLQWQAGALKLFMIDPTFKKGTDTPERDSRLRDLAVQFCNHFNLDPNKNLNASGKFRSVTICRWNIFDDCRERACFLAESIDYLCDLKG